MCVQDQLGSRFESGSQAAEKAMAILDTADHSDTAEQADRQIQTVGFQETEFHQIGLNAVV